jgi:RNA-directed DNA polymerase
VVPMSQTNKTGPPEAQFGEGRERTTENTLEPDTCSTQSEGRVSQGLQGVRHAAKERKQEKFTALQPWAGFDIVFSLCGGKCCGDAASAAC